MQFSQRHITKTLRIVFSWLLTVSLFAQADDAGARRKTRSGRFTATDLQVFNPNFRPSKASVEWINQTGQVEATLPVDLSLRSTRYYTIEESGLVSPSFIGGLEIVSATEELYGVVTHFDKGIRAPKFERGNEHYEIRSNQYGTLLNAPLIVQDESLYTNISLLNPADNGTANVTIELYASDGTPTAYNTSIVGNALIEISDTILVGNFVGSARIVSDKPIAAYISIYGGESQGGYSASPEPINPNQNAVETAQADVMGYYPNLQPTDDALATRLLYISNPNPTEVTVTLRTRSLVLANKAIVARGQFSLSVLFDKRVTELFLSANQPIESALIVSDKNGVVSATVAPAVTGLAVYPMLKPSSQTRNANVLENPTAPMYCAVAPTIYAGYRNWQTTLKLLNPLTTTGSVTVTFIPALSASEMVSSVVVTRALPPNSSVIPNYIDIADSNAVWSAYLESNVPFYGDATSVKANETDGLMSYRLELVPCASQSYKYYFPIMIR